MILRAIFRTTGIASHCQIPPTHRSLPSLHPRPTPSTPLHLHRRRPYTTKPSISIDERMEQIQELYATAKDEFEIATEETEKQTVYAADDRAAAQEELGKLKTAFEEAVGAEGGEEIRRRVGQRVRELEGAVGALVERGSEAGG